MTVITLHRTQIQGFVFNAINGNRHRRINKMTEDELVPLRRNRTTLLRRPVIQLSASDSLSEFIVSFLFHNQVTSSSRTSIHLFIHPSIHQLNSCQVTEVSLHQHN